MSTGSGSTRDQNTTPEWPKTLEPEGELQRRKRRRMIFIVVGLIAVILAATAVEVYFQQQTQPSALLGNVILFTLVININAILVMILLLLVSRNLVKLYFERRKKIIGSRFRTKLVTAFVGLTLIPSILLFLVASGFITSTIDKWFNVQVEKSLKESLDLAESYYRDAEKNVSQHADQLAQQIAEKDMLSPENQEYLANTVQRRRVEFPIDGVQVFDRTLKPLLSEKSENVGDTVFIQRDSPLLKKALRGDRETEVVTVAGREVVRALTPVIRAESGQVAGVVAVSYFLPQGLATKVYDIKEAFEEYKQKQIFKAPIKAQYVVLFLMFTLLIVFSATWFGLYLAKGITVPLQELVEGTRAIAGGRLDFTISTRADDEIGMLVDSFNKMTSDLQRSQQELERTNVDLRHTNVELDQRRSYMETVLENITTGVLSLDPRGRITTFNRAAERILGIDAAGAKGRHYRAVFRSDHLDPVRALMKKMNENGAASTASQMHLTSGGRNLTLITSVTRLQDREGSFLGMVIVFDDLSELIKAQRTAAWQEVARGIAHEIKNPLTPIQLSTQRLRKKFQDKSEDFEKIFDQATSTIIQQVEVIKGMVDEFSKFARMPLPDPKPHDLRKIIEDATGLYRSSLRTIEIVSFYDPNVPLLDLDREQMQRVFINLLENSVDAIEGRGRIEIRTSLDAQRQRVSIEVSDDGIGIPVEDRDKLFAPYFSSKKRGTGLGLAIVQRIVADHNGTVYVRDNQPRGTKVVIELPLGPHKAQAGKKIISV